MRLQQRPFAFHNHPCGHRLDPAGGQPRHDLLPQDRRNLVPVQAVQQAPGLLGVNQATVNLAGRLDGGLYRGRGDLVEDHALDFGTFGGIEDLEQVPRDCLALAILIGGQIELVGVFHQRLEVLEVALLVGIDHVQRLEVVVDIYAHSRPLLGLVSLWDLGRVARQVANMADGRLDHVVVAEVARNGAGLGGGLDNN